MKLKLVELAKLAGVSRTTASYVVNGKAKAYRVSDKTIEKVEKLIKQYDFKPNAMAAGLRAGKIRTIGLIVPDFENASFARIATHLEAGFRQKGYQLVIACSNDNPETEMQCAKHLIQRQIDALIVSTTLPADTDFYQRHANIPIICFDRYLDLNKIRVLTDDEGDSYRLATHLGRHCEGKRMLFLGALPKLGLSRKRELGFRQALSDKANQVDYLYASQFHKLASAKAFHHWLEKHEMPEAIFATSLTLLHGVFQILIKRYHRIPRSLIIATFGHHDMLDLLENKVICCVQNHEKIAQTLLHLVLSRMKSKNVKVSDEVIIREIIESRI
ncbi:TPA: catabolite repressor/activator [Pasteurella multocida]